MAWFNEQGAGGAVNVAANVGAEVRNVSRNGTSVYFEYRAYIYQSTSTYSTNTWALWVEGNQNNVKGRGASSQGTKYYTGWYGKSVSLGVGTSSTSVSIGVNGNAWNPSSPAGHVTLTLSGLPTCSSPSLSALSISNVSDTSAKIEFSITNSNNGSVTDSYIDIFRDSGLKDKAATISSRSGTFTGLDPNRTYWARGNAANAAGRSYTGTKSFTTGFINPGAPSNLKIECSNDEPIINAQYTLKWTAGSAGSKPISGYRLRIYKNDAEYLMVDTESTDTEYVFDMSTSDFQVGDEFKFGLYSYSKDWNNGKHFNGGGASTSQVLSGKIIIVSDKYIYVSLNGDAFDKRKMYISINGDSFKEVKKEKFKIIQ